MAAKSSSNSSSSTPAVKPPPAWCHSCRSRAAEEDDEEHQCGMCEFGVVSTNVHLCDACALRTDSCRYCLRSITWDKECTCVAVAQGDGHTLCVACNRWVAKTVHDDCGCEVCAANPFIDPLLDESDIDEDEDIDEDMPESPRGDAPA